MKPFQIKVDKPWGYEFIFTPPESCAVGKLLHLNAGSRFSLQYHEIKEETLVLVKGEAKISYGESESGLVEEMMKLNFGYFIDKGLIHRVQATTDCDILEASTPETGKTVRLKDDYNRGDETETERKHNRH